MRVDLGAAALEVEDHGEGVPVILLHGFPLSSAIWTPVRTAVEQVARLVTPDLRGFGASAKPAAGYAIADLADDVVRLADALKLDRFVLGGHSMGGYVALEVAAAHPERLAGLVLIDTRAEADAPEGRRRRDAGIARIVAGDAAGFLDEFVAGLVGPSSATRAPRVVAELRAIAAEAAPDALAGCLAGMRDRPDRRDLLAAVNVPALVVVGQEDSLTPPASSRALASALPRATLVEIPSAGHTPSMERPIPTAEAILGFLRAHYPAPPAALRPRAPR
ncbi:MAG: alpha/beta fold hydrolase [Thermoanaerobaculaceae bacterium]|nr:alpha/beta fold hydrolase [Thermoanaerobaculaceae bacterium]TAM46929.1 MAG: alpha/beta fold hydrolase [Acidobacteriota bacterium]